ncbi:MAG: argininosuccinate lyase [Bacillota bacterium]
MWQGRFSKETEKEVLHFTASLPFDRRLAMCDIKGSTAHVEMLAAQNIICQADADSIIKGLEEIREEIANDQFPYDLDFEDIHMNIEKRLTEIIGSVGGKLHTGRSRNDQVALDMHLYMKEETLAINRSLIKLQETILNMAEQFAGVLIPGYTHLQRAQPVLLSHHFMAYFWMFDRDRGRLVVAYRGADIMPLGAGALAGTGFAVDREMVADKLGFEEIYENSIDAVSDRDYLIEFMTFAATLIMHLSRFCEELVLWSSFEYDFIELDDAFTTGSSMMPQKKNPDLAELIRGKSGRVYGHLFSLLTMMKGLPLAYNKDMQEDKEGVFDAIDNLKALLPLFTDMLKTMKINHARLEEAVDDDYLCATDLADYLVREGVSFREAHHCIGEMIAFCQKEGFRLKELSPQQREQFHPALAKEISFLLDPQKVVEARKSRGGTAPTAVKEQLKKARERLIG